MMGYIRIALQILQKKTVLNNAFDGCTTVQDPVGRPKNSQSVLLTDMSVGYVFMGDDYPRHMVVVW